MDFASLFTDPVTEDPVAELEQIAKALTPRPAVEKRRTTDGPSGTEWVRLATLRVDHAGGTQRPPDREKIASMVAHLRAGGKLAPIKVNQRPDGSQWLTDGQHRVAAGLICGIKRAQAEVTHLPSFEEAEQVEILTKIASGNDHQAAEQLLAAGAQRVGDRLILDLGKSGAVSYQPHDELVAEADRGCLHVISPRARRVLERLQLVDYAA